MDCLPPVESFQTKEQVAKALIEFILTRWISIRTRNTLYYCPWESCRELIYTEDVLWWSHLLELYKFRWIYLNCDSNSFSFNILVALSVNASVLRYLLGFFNDFSQKVSPSMGLWRHNVQSSSDQECWEPRASAELCSAPVQRLASIGSYWAALGSGVNPHGAVLLLTPLCWQVIPGQSHWL